ncbi:hypothetical protein [Saccharopolyspora taberi]
MSAQGNGVEGAQWRGGGSDGLPREVRRQTSRRAGPDAGKVVGWLHRQTGAEVALVCNHAESVASHIEGFPRETLRPLAPLLARMSSGQLAAAATRAEGLHVRCEALGADEPHPVLVVAGRSEPRPEAVSLTSHVGLGAAFLASLLMCQPSR